MSTDAVRVLVLVDDPRVRAGLRRLLEAAPGVAVAALGADADVALVDIDGPDRGAATARVRGLAGGVPVVALGLDGPTGAAALTAGARRFVEKDGRPETLLSALHAAVRSAGST